MPEYIVANIEFNEKNSATVQSHKHNLQLSALAFSSGQQSDVAVLPFIADADYMAQINLLKLPVQETTRIDLIPEGQIINPWKCTKIVSDLALEHDLKIKYPYSNILETIDSKAHSFFLMKPNFESILINSIEDIKTFLKGKKGIFVIKSNFSQSGFGHYFVEASSFDPSDLPTGFTIQNSRLERWVERVFDFSSQWLLEESFCCLGVCELINNKKGGYLGSIFPLQTKEYDDFICEHLTEVNPIIKSLHAQGFRGHLGIDAFIFKTGNKLALCPLIEINPRKTMGFVALNLSQHFDRSIKIEIGNFDLYHSLLPKQISTAQHRFIYKKNINFHFLEPHR
jgi:hypothetical protein